MSRFPFLCVCAFSSARLLRRRLRARRAVKSASGFVVTCLLADLSPLHYHHRLLRRCPSSPTLAITSLPPRCHPACSTHRTFSPFENAASGLFFFDHLYLKSRVGCLRYTTFPRFPEHPSFLVAPQLLGLKTKVCYYHGHLGDHRHKGMPQQLSSHLSQKPLVLYILAPVTRPKIGLLCPSVATALKSSDKARTWQGPASLLPPDAERAASYDLFARGSVNNKSCF